MTHSSRGRLARCQAKFRETGARTWLYPMRTLKIRGLRPDQGPGCTVTILTSNPPADNSSSMRNVRVSRNFGNAGKYLRITFTYGS